MKPTFLPEESGPGNQIFVIVSAGNLRDLWATRLRNELYNGIIATGGNPSNMSEKERLEIEESLRIQARDKFPENANYKVRAYEDDNITPVTVFGDEATVINEIEVVPPVECFQYIWDVTRVKPDTKVVTLQYKDCDGLAVTVTDTVANLTPGVAFFSPSDPSITDGSWKKEVPY